MRDKIKLVSSAGTGHYYTTTKNKRTQPEKMEIKKYDPVVRKHVAYELVECGFRAWFQLLTGEWSAKLLRRRASYGCFDNTPSGVLKLLEN